MRILVTEGNGFIGAHVLRQLVADGHMVSCFDVSEPSPVVEPIEEEVSFVSGDVTDPVDVYNAIERFEPNRIVHLAGLLGHASQTRPRAAFSVNVDGTFNVLEAADGLGVDRVVAASSAAVYGDVSSGVDRLDETVPRQPTSVYGLTKQVVEDVGPVYRDQRDVQFTAIEPVHGLGPGRRRGNLQDVSIVKAAVAGERIPVPARSNPFEIVYVEDEARAFVDAALADDLPNDRYLVGSGERTTLVEFVDAVREHVPGANFELEPVESEDRLSRLPPSDTTRICGDFGWRPEYTISEAIGAYVSWLRGNPSSWEFDRDAVPWPTG